MSTTGRTRKNMIRLVSQCDRMQQELCREAGRLTCIVGRAAVVRGRKKRNEVALCKALKAIHDALMRSHNHLQVVCLHKHTRP